MKTELDIKNWKRESHFNFFKQYDNPFFNICSTIEVTELYGHCKKNNYSFFLASLYLSIKAANNIEEFRYRIENEKVFIYDQIHPFSTIPNDDNTFAFCEFNYKNDFVDFQSEGKTSIEKIKKMGRLESKGNRNDVIHYTTIPWISFTSLMHPRKFNTNDSIPKIAFGKYFEEGSKLMIPISIDAHHSLVDGYHLGKLLELFRNYIIKSDVILK